MSDISSPPDFGPQDEGEAIIALAATYDKLAAQGLPATPSALIWESLCDAVAVVESLPDQERKWLRGGSGGWGMVGMTRTEAEEVEWSRIMTGLQPGDALRASSTPTQIDNALSVCKWLAWCRVPAESDDFHQVVYWVAVGNADGAAARVRGSRRSGSVASFAKDVRARAVGRILKGLQMETRIHFNKTGFILDQ